MNLPEKITIRIRNSEGTLFEGKAGAVSSENSQGKFDILPEHAQMVTLIEGHEIVLHSRKGEGRRYKFNQAVLHVHNNIVSIYVAG